MIKSKKLVSLLLVVVLTFATTLGTFADTNANDKVVIPKNNTVKVYDINENGIAQESALSYDFFKELVENGIAYQTSPKDLEGTITPNVVPPPEGSILIASPIRNSFTLSNYSSIMDFQVAGMFGVAWTLLNGRLVQLGGAFVNITQNIWINNYSAVFLGYIVGRASSVAKITPTYSEAYKYKTWSTYWDCYVTYSVVTFYSDSSYNNPIEVNNYVDFSTYQAGILN